MPVQNPGEVRPRVAQIIPQYLSRVCWIENHDLPPSDNPGNPQLPRLRPRTETSAANCHSRSPTSAPQDSLSTDVDRCPARSYPRGDSPRPARSAAVSVAQHVLAG